MAGSCLQCKDSGLGAGCDSKRCLMLTSESDEEKIYNLKQALEKMILNPKEVTGKVLRCQAKFIYVYIVVSLRLLYSKAYMLTSRLCYRFGRFFRSSS